MFELKFQSYKKTLSYGFLNIKTSSGLSLINEDLVFLFFCFRKVFNRDAELVLEFRTNCFKF